MIKFGPSGNCESFYLEGNKTTLQAPKWIKNKGLNAFEYSFGKGYNLSSEKAKEIGQAFAEEGISLSLHAPYYINFANPDNEMYQKTIGYIFTGIKFLRNMSATRLVFHPGSCGKMPRQEALDLIKTRMQTLMNDLNQENLLKDVYLCPETMGKSMQIGTYKEVIDICSIDEHLIPTFDFGHINALTQGGLKTPDDYKEIFDYSFEKLGDYRTKNCHIHFSKIEYGAKGEIRHLNFDDITYGPEFDPLAKVLHEYKLTPTILSESAGWQAEDALKMKEIYEKFIKI